jgi:hypothetical protein
MEKIAVLHIIFNYTYYGWYSNKKRGMRKDKEAVVVPGQPEPDTDPARSAD